MTGPRFPALIAALPETVPFVGPEVQERARGAAFDARLGANESMFGPSPKAIEAMSRAASEIWQYADPTNFDLRQALAQKIGCGEDALIVGEGIDALLGYLVRLLVSPGDAVVTSDGAYPTFNYHVAGFGGHLHKVPYQDDRENLAALLDLAAKVGAKTVYFANPDNPMGTWTCGKQIEDLLDRIPDGTLLALDEAYIEFAPDDVAPRIAWDDPRVIRFRTFSKAYGMAGARVGYAIAAPELIRAFDKIRNHFGMNRAAQIGALAAIEDQAHLSWVVSEVETAKAHIAEIARQNGLTCLPSATNFVAVDCGRDGSFATAVLQGLVARGVFVRKPFVAPQDRCIRISAGPKDALQFLANALPLALQDAQDN